MAPTDVEPAAWLSEWDPLGSWTVGGLLSDRYESYLLVEGAPGNVPNWWEAQRQIVDQLAKVLVEFTHTPDRAWFAIWEGHGFEGPGIGVGGLAADHALSPEDLEEAVARYDTLRADQASSALSIREALGQLPHFASSMRTYYLLGGTVTDVDRIRRPNARDQWFRPDLWWPDDHKWLVGTDVDFWCNYVGGSKAMTDALASRLPNLCHPVTVDERLRLED